MKKTATSNKVLARLSIKPLVAAILATILLIAGSLLTILGFDTREFVTINYSDQSTIDYKVYLKENRFFDTPYLPAGRTYITNLIDYLDIDMSYSLNFDDAVDLNYSYYYVATISAAKDTGTASANKGEYWSKTYNLTNATTQSATDTHSLSVGQNLKVNYADYNQILSDFKSTYSLAATGTLKIAMVLDGEITSAKFDEALPFEYSEVYLSIPLTEQSVEASVVGSTSDTQSHSASKEVNKDNFLYLALRILGIIMIIASVLGFAFAWLTRKQKTSSARYNDAVKHLIGSYDSIIVEVNERPKTAGLNVLTVNRFDELLDVYNSIHLPISCYRGDKKTEFIIVGEHMAWEYSVKTTDFTKRK